MDTRKKNDANQANTYVQIILKKLWHAVIVFVQVRDALLGLLNLINAHSSKLRKPKLAKLSSREIPKEGPRPNQRAFEEQRTVNLRVRETSSLSLTVLLVLLTALLGPLTQWTQPQEKWWYLILKNALCSIEWARHHVQKQDQTTRAWSHSHPLGTSDPSYSPIQKWQLHVASLH